MVSFPSGFSIRATNPVRRRGAGWIGSLLFEHDPPMFHACPDGKPSAFFRMML
jgi:hypothetical protein